MGSRRSGSTENFWHVCPRIPRLNRLHSRFAWIFDDRTELLAEAPDVYYVTEHYVDYDAVPVRPSRITPDLLRDLLGMAYKFVSSRGTSRSPSRKKRNIG